MCFEGMEENGSENLDKFIESEKDKFFAGVDCMCISGEPYRAHLMQHQLTHRQLLAGYQDPLFDLRSARRQLLRDPNLGPYT
jgi:Cys-Gly metallodipeptidase DUG1